jgi:NAD(P)-dependent dehydrogenase (short-subunit alcohol dehydrogenase family)
MSSVLITGASRGIGRAAALALDREGHEVIAGVRDAQAAARLAAEASGRLRTVRLDVTDASSVRAAADAVGGRLDALVNNAGVVVGGIVEALDLEALRRQLEVNVVGQAPSRRRCCRPFARRPAASCSCRRCPGACRRRS